MGSDVTTCRTVRRHRVMVTLTLGGDSSLQVARHAGMSAALSGTSGEVEPYLRFEVAK